MTENTTNPEQVEATPASHLTDGDMINATVLAMTQKMEQARFKGRSGWQNAPAEHIAQGYTSAVQKGGSAADVMNYAGMLYCRGEDLPAVAFGSPQQKTCEQVVLWAIDKAGIALDDPEALAKLQNIIADGIDAQNPDQ